MKIEDSITQSDDQFLRIADVSGLTTLSKSSINLWVSQSKFPQPITLSKTVRVWSLKEIRDWAEKLKAAR